MVFAGRRNQQIFAEYSQWLPYITDVFFPIIESESGDYRHFPYEGSIMEQPYMTMQILNLIQINYKKVLAERMQKMKAKSSGMSRRR